MSDTTPVENSQRDPAIEWLLEIRSSDVSPERIAAWQQWLANSPEHQQSFDDTLFTWHLASKARRVSWPTDAECAEDRYDGSLPIGTKPSEARPADAAAARSAPAAAAYERSTQSSSATRSVHGRALHQSALLRAAALAGVAASLVLVFLYWSWGGHVGSATETTQVIETRDGGNRTVTLSEGSVVTVGPRSLALVTISPSMRRVLLERGEAYFSVAKDSRRPFQVRAGDTAATAVGTAFDVRREDEQVVVAVAQGVVRVVSVAPAGPAATARTVETSLRAGQKLTVDGSRNASEADAAAPTGVGTEKHGRLEYVGETLGAVAADLSRYTSLKIEIIDPLVASLRFTGTVSRGEVEDWLKSVEATFPVRVERPAAGVVRLVATTDDGRIAVPIRTPDIIR